MAAEGAFVVLEGIDGSGTSTQAALLVEALASRGHRARLTCEPSSGPIGKLLREMLANCSLEAAPGWATMALLFAADRADHVDHVIAPGMSSGAIVVSDRYDLSSLVYQSLTAPHGPASVDWIRQLNSRALRPDLTLVLDVDAKQAAARRSGRSGSPELYEELELQMRLAEAYARSEDFIPHHVVEHVDGAPAVEVVAQRVLRSVEQHLGLDSRD